MDSRSFSVKFDPVGKAGSDYDYSQLARRWKVTEGTLDDLLTHANEKGLPWSPAVFKGGHRTAENFLYADWIAIDLDGAGGKGMTEDEYAQAINCYFRLKACAIAQTASSKSEARKARVIFQTSRRITDPEEYAALVRYLAGKSPHADMHSAERARFYYGAPGGEIDYKNAQKVLDLDALRDELKEAVTSLPAPAPRPICTDQSVTARYIQASVMGEIAILNNTPRGEGNAQLYTSGLKVGGWVKSGLLSESDARAHIMSTDVWTRRPLSEAEDTLRSAFKNAAPRYVPAPTMAGQDSPPPAVKPLEAILEAVPAQGSDPRESRVNVPYMTDAGLNLEGKTTLIKSIQGTGKTELVSRLIAQNLDKKWLYLTHRVSLTTHIAARLGITDYDGLTPEARVEAAQLAMTVNSLESLPELPEYDFVVLDEVEQLLDHLLGDTFKGAQGIHVHERLKYIIQNAGSVVAMDADAGEKSRNWLALECLRDDVHFVVNDYTPPPIPLTLYHEQSALLSALDAHLGKAKTPIILFTDSLKDSKRFYEYHAARLGAGAVRVINSENSHRTDVKAFIRDINARLPELRLLICSPSMVTGVDITTPIEAVYGTFHREPLTAPDMLQMLARARNAKAAFVSLPSGTPEEPRETNPDALYAYYLTRAIRTGRTLQKAGHTALLTVRDGVTALSNEQASFLRLYAASEAIRNRSFNRLSDEFKRLAGRRYTLLDTDAATDDSLKEALREIGEAIKEREKALVLSVDIVTPDRYRELALKGVASERDRAGLERWKIIDTYQQLPDETLYDHWRDGKGRSELLAFTDLLTPSQKLMQFDAQEQGEGVPLHTLKHVTARAMLTRQLLKALWGSEVWRNPDDLTAPVDNVQIELGIQEFLLGDGGKLLKQFFQRRDIHSEKPLNVLRFVLGRMGLKLEQVRNCEAAKAAKTRGRTLYRVTRASFDLMMGLHAQRRAGLERHEKGASLREFAIYKESFNAEKRREEGKREVA